jgi:hypothetical protein
MKIEPCEIRIRGENLDVPSVRIRNCTVIALGKWLRTARLFDEELIEEVDFSDPSAFVAGLRESPLKVDVFTFASQGYREDRQFDSPFQWDNVAVVGTTSFENWWKELPQESRKNVRLAGKRGVVVAPVNFDDSLVSGIKRIYDETPIRQGRRFWHFGKELSRVKSENATYLQRSQFIGAFVEGELIGFIKYVRVDRTAVLIQILAMERHRDRRPMNALLKEAIELCGRQGLTRMTYGKFDYGVQSNSSLTEFKRRNGFSELRFRRYFVPLTTKGRLAISMGLHLGIREIVPLPVTTALHRTMARFLQGAYRRSGERTS